MKILVLFFLLLSLVDISFAVYPQFNFVSSPISSGPVNILGEASSSTQIELYVNGNFVGRQDAISSQRLVLLNNSIVNVQVGLASSIIFKNNDLLNPMTINFSGQVRVLNIGDTYTFNAENTQGDLIYTHIETGQRAIISVKDELVNFGFLNIEQTYLLEGINSFGFIQKYPLSSLNSSKTYNMSVFYDKYPNSILILNSTNITKLREGKYSGRVLLPTNPLYYVLNYEGPIGNTGVLKSVPYNGSTFSFSINKLREGNNTIRFISTDPTNINIFTGEVKVNTFVDTINPYINIIDSYFIDKEGYAITANFNGETQYFNGLNLLINLSTDAKTFEVILNNVSQIEEVDATGQGFLNLGLKEGTNVLTFIAIDIAGNIFKESHVIKANILGPQLILKELKPEDLFSKNGVAHFYFQQIKGKVDEPNVDITVFSFVRGSAGFQNQPPGYEEPQSCGDFKSSFIRNLGQLDRKRPNGPQLNLDETQTSASFQSFIFNKQETTSDENGNFDVILGLQEKDFDSKDYNTAFSTRKKTQSDLVGSVRSENIICFVLKDKYENVNIVDFQVTLDAGNTQWRPGEITTIPNTIYAAEIENTGDLRSGSGNIRYGMIAKFQYIGPGKVKTLNGIRITEERGSSKYGENYVKTRIVQNEMNYRLNTLTGEMIVYVPVEVLALGIPPSEYPDNFDLAFEARVTYTVDDVEIPIDTKNPVYFRTKLNVERPLDHTKWLTPKMLDDTLGFLNKSIYYTQKATDYMGFAAIGGVLTCTGAKFWYGVQASTLEADSKELEDAERTLYLICDRVASTASPYKCDLVNNDIFLTEENYTNGVEYKSGSKLIGIFKPRVGGKCEYTVGGKKKEGISVGGEGKKFKEGTTDFAIQREVTSQIDIKTQCLPYDNKTKGINFGSLKGNICYSPGKPQFDDTRCNFFRADDSSPDKGVPGKDSSTSIFSSIRCGAITDTYSHLKNALKIQIGIQKCLEQAKIGYVKGSYCERLLSQAVCDIATNVILPELQQNIDPRKGASKEEIKRNPLTSFLGQMKANEKAFNDRYSGTLLSQAGLSTDQIINKACVGAITGDWSVLSDNILTSIDQNEVEPVFGPPFPESRLQGYNPLTGELSIRYFFTYGVISGGQVINSEVEFICDSNAANGEYCPEDGLVSSKDVSGSSIRPKRLSVNKGSSRQDSVIITDVKAKFWYNKLRITHTYKLKNEFQTEVREFPIIHKDDSLLAQCHFTGGTLGSGKGLSCNIIFEKDALISVFTIDEGRTNILPEKQKTFFPGNTIYLNLGYSLKNNEEFNQDISLAYMAVCNEGTENEFILKEGGSPTPYKPLSNKVPILQGNKVLQLYSNLPEIGSSGDEDRTASINDISIISNEKEQTKTYNAIRFVSLSGTEIPTYSIDRILIEDKIPKDSSGVEIKLSDSSGYIPQNLNINSNNPKVQSKLIDLDTVTGGSNLKIIFKSKPQNLRIELVKIEEKEDIKNIVSTREISFSNSIVQEGQCNLYMRLLPTSEVTNLQKDNFKTYNPLSGNNDGGDILTNVKDNEIIKKTFNLKKRRSLDLINYFTLVKPNAGSGVCVPLDSNGEVSRNIEIPIEYIFQNTQAKKDIKGSLSYSITSSRYSFGSEGIGVLDEGIKVGQNSNNLVIAIPNSLKTVLENTNNQDTLVDKTDSQLFGSTIPTEIIFSYTAKAQNKIGIYDKEMDNGKRSVKFLLTASKNCGVKNNINRD